MSDAPNTAPPLPESLQAVLTALDAFEQALREGQSDTLPALSEALARALQHCQREWAQPSSQTHKPNSNTIQAMRSVGTRLATLRELLQRQNSSTHRMLAAMFPSEQVNAYSRLGQNTGAASTRLGQQTSFKA